MQPQRWIAVASERLANGEDIDAVVLATAGWIRYVYGINELDEKIVGFSIVDLEQNNVWALFVKPGFDKQGIGKLLHDTMMDWYFDQTTKEIWLGTSPNTRAELFYRKAGWIERGKHGSDEIKFEMTLEIWSSRNKVSTT